MPAGLVDRQLYMSVLVDELYREDLAQMPSRVPYVKSGISE